MDDDCDTQIDEGCNLWYRDADSDGYGDPNDSDTYEHDDYTTQNAQDCNDGNAAINPGASETCNGTDDDCDGVIDEGVKTTFYADTDSDGYGDPASTTQACSAPSGYVANDDDCDDSDSAVNPGASETCNGVDDDCDTQIDEGCSLLYRDGDSDGYGNPAGPTSTVPQAGLCGKRRRL